jgi:hypothetical protein
VAVAEWSRTSSAGKVLAVAELVGIYQRRPAASGRGARWDG